MGIFETQFLSNLLSIIMIDIVLGGDNAILIALATRKLPKKHRKKAIFWGVFGAIAVRAALTVIAVYIFNIPLIQLIGGVLLIWIAYKLLVDEEKHEEVKPGESIRQAIKTIVVADLLMGIDNVLAVAGAAEGHPLLVILGLLISIPIIVWGSTIILQFIDRFPIIVYIGAGVIAWTAGKMITHDKYTKELLLSRFPILDTLIPIIITVLIIAVGYFIRKKRITTTKFR